MRPTAACLLLVPCAALRLVPTPPTLRPARPAPPLHLARLPGAAAALAALGSQLAVPAASAEFDLLYELNKPPIELNPFTVNPSGGLFFSLYVAYLGWSIFRPASAEEQEYNAQVNAASEKAQAAGAAFLAEAAAAEGASASASGLVFQLTAPGSGAPPGAGDTVVVHYKGTLADGTTFDSSYDRGEPRYALPHPHPHPDSNRPRSLASRGTRSLTLPSPSP